MQETNNEIDRTPISLRGADAVYRRMRTHSEARIFLSRIGFTSRTCQDQAPAFRTSNERASYLLQLDRRYELAMR